MKRFSIILCLTVLAACGPQDNYKAVRNEVMDAHDVVMNDQGRMVRNEMSIKAMLKDLGQLQHRFPGLDTLKEKQRMLGILDSLNAAEESMNDWMHTFEPDVTGKTNAEATAYFRSEKKKVEALDSLFKTRLRSSDAYLRQFNK